MTKIIIVSGTSTQLPKDWRFAEKPRIKHPLHGVKIKIARANEHVENIQRIVGDFASSHRIVRDVDPDGTHETVKLVIPPIPEKLPIIIAEAVYHLRSALDNLACCLAVKNGQKPTEVSFPISGDRNKFESSATQRRIKKLSPATQKLIHRLKPYKGGNNLLWTMNRFRNDDIHIRLLPVIVKGPNWRSSTIRTLIPPGGTIEIEYPQTFEDQIILARCSRGAQIEYDAEPVIDIAFGDVEFLKGKSVVARLREMVNLTKRIVNIFERFFFR